MALKRSVQNVDDSYIHHEQTLTPPLPAARHNTSTSDTLRECWEVTDQLGHAMNWVNSFGYFTFVFNTNKHITVQSVAPTWNAAVTNRNSRRQSSYHQLQSSFQHGDARWMRVVSPVEGILGQIWSLSVKWYERIRGSRIHSRASPDACGVVNQS